MPLTCNITIEDTKITIDERQRFTVSRPTYFTMGLTLQYSDDNPTKLTFKNVSNTIPYEFHLDLAMLPCQALKTPLWPMFGVLYDAVLKTMMSSKMPDYCVF